MTNRELLAEKVMMIYEKHIDQAIEPVKPDDSKTDWFSEHLRDSIKKFKSEKLAEIKAKVLEVISKYDSKATQTVLDSPAEQTEADNSPLHG
jgi:hypothetical protein